MIYMYNTDAATIRERLESGAALVACLCTQRCHRCDDWWGDFTALSKTFPQACFVWLDVDEHPDMIADISGVSAYPFLLVQNDTVRLLQTVPPDRDTVALLLQQHLLPKPERPEAASEKAIIEPGLYSFLLE